MNEKKFTIGVLIKQVPIPSQMRATKEGLMDRSVASMMNPYCKHALEAALQLKDTIGEDQTEIWVASMGPPNFEQSLREALSMGADHAVLLSDRKLAGSDTYATAKALSALLNTLGVKFDIIFAGLQTIDGDTAHVGPQVAERLELPHISYVEGIEYKGNHLLVRRILEGGSITYKVPLPCLLTITNTANTPRGPRLKYAIQARKKEIKTYSVADIGLKDDEVGLIGSPTIVWRVKNVTHDRPPCQFMEGETVEEKVKHLLQAIASPQVEEEQAEV